MTWHIDWPSFAFGCSAGFVIAIFLLGLLRAVAMVDTAERDPLGIPAPLLPRRREVDMVPRFVVPDRPEMTDADEYGAEEGAQVGP